MGTSIFSHNKKVLQYLFLGNVFHEDCVSRKTFAAAIALVVARSIVHKSHVLEHRRVVGEAFPTYDAGDAFSAGSAQASVNVLPQQAG